MSEELHVSGTETDEQLGRLRYTQVDPSQATSGRAADATHARGPRVEEGTVPPALDFEVMAQGGQATVCAAAPVCERDSAAYQSEAALEAAFIEQLQDQAYEYVRIESEEALISNLRRELEALNGVAFTDEEWPRFFEQHVAGRCEGIVEKTRRIQCDHVQAFRRDDGTTKNIRLIDKANIHNNHLQVMNQYETDAGAHKNRYDVTILVNGLPLVHVELKRRGVPLREAFNQIERYQRDSFWAGSGLFEYVQVFVISNGTHTKYYSNTTRMGHIDELIGARSGRRRKTSHSFEFTNWWAAADNAPIVDLVPFSATFFSKHTLLAILTKYCVFTEEELLLVLRPYQIVATERILNRTLVSEGNPKLLGTPSAGGYVWHTTGSGKTLTSFLTARLASDMEGVDKVLFVVDRRDLDYQTMREYDRFEKGAANGSTSTAVLARQLADPACRILVTTIQKLDCFIKKNPAHDVYGKHVVIMFDECHRGQFGQMHTAITKRFKSYHLFGFTGTPIFAANAQSGGRPDLKTTEQAFGDRLHTYTIVDAIRDGNVLPFRVDYVKTLRERGDMEDEKVYAIYRQSALKAQTRVDAIVGYILDHWRDKTKADHTYEVKGKRLRGFNSLFAVDSIDMAKVYYTAFKRLQDETGGVLTEDGTQEGRGTRLKVAVIYSFQANEADEGCGLPDESFDVESLDAPSRDFLDAAIDDYNELFSTNFSTDGDGFQNYYKDVSDRMKSRELDLLIVVGMFLTGFDATTLNTLWVDRDLRLHGLIQAFSRTNRILNSVKSFGNIVCFRNLEDEVNEALSLFGDADARGIVLLRPYADYLGEYRERLAELTEHYPLDGAIVGEEAERDFIRLFGIILRLRNVLCCFDEFADDDTLSARDEQDWRSIYVDLYEKYRAGDEKGVLINEDVVFEVELMRSADVSIDYILMLVQKYHDDNCRDKTVLEDVQRALGAAPALRDKRDLVTAFIDSLESSEDVSGEWKAYVRQAAESELAAIIAEEALDEAATRELMARSLAQGGVPAFGTDVASLMTRKPSRFVPSGDYEAAKQRVLGRLQAYCGRFGGLVG